MDWKQQVLVIVFAAIMAGVLTPIVVRWLSKKGIIKNKKD